MSIQFLTEYNVACPECRAQGKQNFLGFSTDEGGICCVEGHKFDALPEQNQPATIANSEPEKSEIPESKPAEAKSVAMAPLPTEHETPGKTAETSEGVTLDEVHQLVNEVQVGTVFFPVKDLKGGDGLVVLKIPERHLIAVRGYAETVNQPVEAYLQEWFVRVLDAEWYK